MLGKSNRLSGELSPYLLQHANNPVDWYPWGAEAFSQARSQDKPVLLSIGYSTCHWCHVMAHESFENEDIAKIINANFIAIKVDREERPDIDHIYMTAVTAMSGQGGWPMTVFLTADGKPFYGGTYFPPYAKWGTPGFADLLVNISQGWNDNRGQIIASGESMVEALQARSLQASTGSSLDSKDLINRAYRHLNGQCDAVNGGFGGAPKFPMGHNLSFLLRYYYQSKEEKSLVLVEGALTAMARGGIRDHLGGGFHRYATDAQWQVPHFEKMLYDQALLLRAYLEAYQVTGNLFYARVAEEILTYVLRDMQSTAGGFYSAEDADSIANGSNHASEGAFYIFSEAEIVATLGNKDAQVFNYCYGIKQNGNVFSDPHGEFVGMNILYATNSIQAAATQFNLSTLAVEVILAQAKAQLYKLRNTRQHPFLDDKVLVDWNGLMIASMAFAGRVLNNDSYTQGAIRATDFILDHMLVQGRLLHRWRESNAGVEATLEDYAFFVYGLIELYEATFNEKYLRYAEQLTGVMRDIFEDPQGGFFMTAIDGEALIFRPKEAYDGAIPSGNSIALYNLLRLHVLTGKGEYQTAAEKLITFFKGTIEASPSAYTFFLSALAFELEGAQEIVLEGPSFDDQAVVKMIQMVYKYFKPTLVLRHRLASQTKAYICRRGVCQKPVDDVSLLESYLVE